MRAFLQILFKYPFFRKLWLSGLISFLGDWLSYIAISLLALHQGGGVISLALLFIAHTLPWALFSPIAGVLADRIDRRLLLIWIRWIQGSLTLLMVLAAFGEQIVLLQLLVFLRSSTGAFLFPAKSAALRRFVKKEDLLLANSLDSATWSVTFALGMALGGLLALLGPVVALLLDAATFWIAGLILLPIPKILPEEQNRSWSSFFLATKHDIKNAWQYAKTQPALRKAVFAKTPLAIAGGGAWIFLNLLADEMALFGSAAITLGLLQASRGTGTGVGPLLISMLERWGISKKQLARYSVLACFLGIALFVWIQHWSFLLWTFLWGMGVGANWVISSASLQRLSRDRYIGRLSSLDVFSFTIGQCFTVLLGAFLVEWTGFNALAAWTSLALGVFAWLFFAWILKPRSLSKTSLRSFFGYPSSSAC